MVGLGTVNGRTEDDIVADVDAGFRAAAEFRRGIRIVDGAWDGATLRGVDNAKIWISVERFRRGAKEEGFLGVDDAKVWISGANEEGFRDRDGLPDAEGPRDAVVTRS